jgi:hypothetical protein
MRKIAIWGVLALMVTALAAVAAQAATVGPEPGTVTSQTGGLHFVGTPTVTATKDASGAFLTANFEVAGAGTTAGATLTSTALVTTGCINRGSKDQQPSGLQTSTQFPSGSTTFQTRQGRAKASVSTTPITTAGRTCPDQMVPVLVGVTFTDITLTVTSQTGSTTATFADIDP